MGTPQDTSGAKWQGKSPCPVPPGVDKNSYRFRRQAREGSQRGLSEQAPPAIGEKEKGDAQRRGKRKRGRNRGVVARTDLLILCK